MKKFFYLVLFSLVLSYGQPTPVMACTNKGKAKLTIEDWLQSGDRVANQSSVQRATMLMAYLETNRLALGKQQPGQINLVLILSTTCLNNHSSLCQNPSIAAAFTFSKTNRAIELSDERKLSLVFMGLSIIHEADHAFMVIEGNFLNAPTFKIYRALLEQNAYELQSQILESLGGLPYQQLLRKEMFRLRPNYIAEQFLAPDPSLNKIDLAHIFGPAVSEQEEKYRATLLWANAYFRLAEELSTNETEAVTKKTQFILRGGQNGAWP